MRKNSWLKDFPHLLHLYCLALLWILWFWIFTVTTLIKPVNSVDFLVHNKWWFILEFPPTFTAHKTLSFSVDTLVLNKCVFGLKTFLHSSLVQWLFCFVKFPCSGWLYLASPQCDWPVASDVLRWLRSHPQLPCWLKFPLTHGNWSSSQMEACPHWLWMVYLTCAAPGAVEGLHWNKIICTCLTIQ